MDVEHELCTHSGNVNFDASSAAYATNHSTYIVLTPQTQTMELRGHPRYK